MSLRLPAPKTMFALSVVVVSVMLPPLAIADPAPTAAPTLPSRAEDQTVALSVVQASVFQDALRAVATQAGLTVVAEDAPFHARLPKDAPLVLPPNTPVSTARDKIAAAFDYDVSRVGSVFVLRKRYTDPRDLPAVTLAECDGALADAARVLGAVNPDPHPEDSVYSHQMMQNLAASLTPSQLQAMRSQSADTGLAMASLSDEQQGFARGFAVNAYLAGSARRFSDAMQVLDQSGSLTLRIIKQHRDFSTSTTINDQTTSQKWSQETVLGYDMVSVARQYTIPGFIPFADAPPPPDAPALPPVETRAVPQPGGDGYTTLGALAAYLTARGGKVAVETALRSKPISVYGADSVSPLDLLRAIATAYGLRVGDDEKARKVLTRPIPPAPDSIGEVAADVWRCLPEPLGRSMRTGDLEKDQRRYQEAKQAAAPTPAGQAALAPLMRQIEQEWQERKNLPYSRHSAAVQRLRIAVDDWLVSHKTSEKAALAHGPSTPPVLLSALPNTAQQAFAVAMTTQIVDAALYQLELQTPDWLSNLDTGYLVGGFIPNSEKPDHPGFMLSIAFPDASGRLVERTTVVTGTNGL